MGMGAMGYGERARRGLSAVGAPTKSPARSTTARPTETLTAQESQIARLAADGRTTPRLTQLTSEELSHLVPSVIRRLPGRRLIRINRLSILVGHDAARTCPPIEPQRLQ
jgi:hypothetical protein